MPLLPLIRGSSTMIQLKVNSLKANQKGPYNVYISGILDEIQIMVTL